MRETSLVLRIKKLADSNHVDCSIIEGIGDDAAVLRPRPRQDLVFTSDLFLEDRHFRFQTHTPADIGHSALARSLSDLAAMGSEPVFCMVSLGVPAKVGSAWVDGFYRGLLNLARRYGMTLVGGDLSQFDKVIADVTCCGRVPRGKAILRSGAKPGDRIYVTGALGAAAHRLALNRKPLRAEPRIRAGIVLRKMGVSAGMDLSDGLSLDLHRLCLESGVSAELGSNLPVAQDATLDEALHGGEDYELLFTASARKRIAKRIAGVAVTHIGNITARRSRRVYFNGRPLKPEGFDHFR